MSAPAHAQTTRPTRAPAPAAQPKAPMRPALDSDHSDLLRLDLSDVPYHSPGLHVEALQPSLLSRFVGLFVR